MSYLFTRLVFLLSILVYANTSLAAQCEHVIANHWGSGFQGEIQITNTGTTPITNWTVAWAYSDGTTVNSVWNANSTGTNPITATPLGWFVSIEPGETWSIGFSANGAGGGLRLKGDVCDSVELDPAKFQLAKTWVNGTAGDAITATTIGLPNNATISSSSIGSNTDNGMAVKVEVGDVVTLPPETFSSGTASDYSTSDWVIAAGNPFTVADADAGNTITCTITNKFIDASTPTPEPSDLACEQVITNNYGSGFIGQIEITNISANPITNWTTTWSYSGDVQCGLFRQWSR